MKHTYLSMWLMRSGIICVWTSLVILFLYSGNFTDLFKSGKNLNVLVWGHVLDKEFLIDFE